MATYLYTYYEEDSFVIIDKDIINEENENELIIIVKDDNNIYNNIKVPTKFACIFNYTKYLNDILKTYSYSWDNIYKQFQNDFARCVVSINNVQFTDIGMFVPQDQMYDISVATLIIMLFNQSSLGYPMECINKFHNLYHGEYLVDTGNTSMYINLNKIDDVLSEIAIYKRLKIIKIADDVIDKYYVDVNLNFLFKNDNSYINLKNINGIVPEYNVLYWTVVPKTGEN